jgi:class 3 adenylate cyclase
LSRESYDRFDHRILGLGNVRRAAIGIEAICAIFDLEGFTNFCRQIDPHLAVPVFMSSFLEWLFGFIKKESLFEELEEGMAMHLRLPFFAKFMGDGVMFLWDAEGVNNWNIANVAALTANACFTYKTEFLPVIRREVTDAPVGLRVGVARGRIYSVGEGYDFVGPAISMAARLQKLAPGLSF